MLKIRFSVCGIELRFGASDHFGGKMKRIKTDFVQKREISLVASLAEHAPEPSRYNSNAADILLPRLACRVTKALLL